MMKNSRLERVSKGTISGVDVRSLYRLKARIDGTTIKYARNLFRLEKK